MIKIHISLYYNVSSQGGAPIKQTDVQATYWTLTELLTGSEFNSCIVHEADATSLVYGIIFCMADAVSPL